MFACVASTSIVLAQHRRGEVVLDRLVGLLPGRVVFAGEVHDGVRRVPVGADQVRQLRLPVGDRVRDILARQLRERADDGLLVGRVRDGSGRGVVKDDDIRVVPAERLIRQVLFLLTLAARRGEAVPGVQLAEHAGAPQAGEHRERESEDQCQSSPPVQDPSPCLEHARLPDESFC